MRSPLYRFVHRTYHHCTRNSTTSTRRPTSVLCARSFYSSPRMASASTSAALYAVVTSAAQLSDSPEDAGDLQHHVEGGKGFRNPWPSYKDFTAWSIMWAMTKHKFSSESNSPDTTPPTVPVQKPVFLPSRETGALRATWLGHACYYIEFPGGLRVLFDPVFEARCSPFSFMGPKRYTEQPCQVENLPAIDAVIISHSHYDHLSHPTVTKIKERFPNCHFFVPLKNKEWFRKQGLHNVTELDWWETSELKLSLVESKGQSTVEVSVESGSDAATTSSSDPSAITATIGCLPCQHTSARTPFDRNHTLWASWSVESGGKKVWFAGDTGYRAVPQLPKGENDYDPKYNFPTCPAFKAIGEHRGPFDLGLIPIGAYDPRFIMSPMHANPFDSANIFLDTQCRRALGMHWGTWVLTEEDVMEPPRLLKTALAQKGIAEVGVFDVCDIGESREY